jgi:outer membrane immunogenic protein
MNKLLVASAAAAFATVGAANAADLPMKAPPMVAAAPVMSWTGCWVSGGIGYGMWNQDEFTNLPTGATSQVMTAGGRGWLGRGGVGCDYQIAPSFVLGVFGDYDFMNLHGTNAPMDTVGGGTFLQPGVANEKESRAWSIGGRLGYLPYPNLMTFVDAGYTQTRFDQQDLTAGTIGLVLTPVSLPQTTFRGWFLGGGTEYAVPWTAFHGLFWRTEYRFSQYQAQNLPFFTTATGAPTGLFENEQKWVQTVTTSLVWKFNFGGPVVAKY